MKYLHTMVRVTDVDASLRFYCDALGLRELSRQDSPQGRFTLIFLAAPGDEAAQVELTHNWDPQPYAGGRNFGHLAYAVDDIYAACRRLAEHGVTITAAAARRAHGVRALPGQHLHRAAAEGGVARTRGTVEVDAQHRHLVSSISPMKTIPSLLIAAVFATLTFAVWAYLNRPTKEPPWPAVIQGFAFSPFRAEPGSDPQHPAHRGGDRRGPGAGGRQGEGGAHLQRAAARSRAFRSSRSATT